MLSDNGNGNIINGQAEKKMAAIAEKFDLS
jgi:hypothetical protein